MNIEIRYWDHEPDLLSQSLTRVEFCYHPPGGFMGTREPQTILKTDESAIRLELGCEGNSPPNQAVGTRTGFSLTR
jgi:hypothetical protein